MIIKIEFDSEIPIYEQIKRQIIIGIANGDLEPGERLPSVRQLGEDLGINLHTVRKAYNILKEEGYLSIDRINGTKIKESFHMGIEEFDKYAPGTDPFASIKTARLKLLLFFHFIIPMGNFTYYMVTYT